MKKIFLLFFTTAITIFLISPATLFAAREDGVTIPAGLYPRGAPTISGEIPSDTRYAEDERGNMSIEEATRLGLVNRILNVIFSIAGIVAIYIIVTNAWFMIISAGSEEVITERKKGLAWAIGGLVLIILAYSIIRFIITITFDADQELNTVSAPTQTKQAASPADTRSDAEREGTGMTPMGPQSMNTGDRDNEAPWNQ